MNSKRISLGAISSPVPHIEAAALLALNETIESVTYQEALSAKTYTVVRSSCSPGWYSAIRPGDRQRAFQFNLENGYDSRDYSH